MTFSRLYESISETKWTESLLNFLEFEIAQKGDNDRHGYKEYFLGIVNKFKRKIAKQIIIEVSMNSCHSENYYNNFFYNLLLYIRENIQFSTNYCFICHKKHQKESEKLRSCSRDACKFSFEEISGVSVYADIIKNPDYVKFNILFAKNAALSNRVLHVFDPFPSFLLKITKLILQQTKMPMRIKINQSS